MLLRESNITMKYPILIIEGCDASGKSTLAQQIMEKYPEGLDRILKYPEEKTMAGAEGSVEFIARIKKVIDSLVAKKVKK